MLPSEPCHIVDFLTELCIEMVGKAGTNMMDDKKVLRKELILGIVRQVALLWEASVGVDPRWRQENHLALKEKGKPNAGERSQRTPQGLKRTLAAAAANVRGSGVKNVSQLSVGLGVAKIVGPIELNPASSQCSTDGPPAKKRFKGGLIPETSCREIDIHSMYNYYLALRLCNPQCLTVSVMNRFLVVYGMQS